MTAATRVAAHAAWTASCLGELVRFRRACRDVRGTQRRLLADTLARNAGTVYGRRYAFGTIRDPAEYRARVPIVTYDEVRDDVDRVARGEAGVLTAERVGLFEPTSGSSGGTKLVPYTASLKREFRRAVDAWLADLYLADPRLWSGQSYWSISPQTDAGATTEGGIPIGFEDDGEYLGAAQRWLLAHLLAVPASVRRAASVDAFQYETLTHLVRSSSLALVSVWNPTFFTLLVERLPGWLPTLAGEVAGTSPRRGRELARIAADGHSIPELTRALWPRLRLVSCWTDANAAEPAADLAALVPHAVIQPKGLLATEAAVSFPLSSTGEPALAVRSHYFEFVPEGAADETVGAHEVEVGRHYSVVVTTGGGLYRYRLGDRVRVVGRVGECPLIRFAGRDDLVSDFVGEKLDERHVASALEAALGREGLVPRFAVVSCERAGAARAYTLFVESDRVGDAALERLAAALEAAFAENFHYSWCRRLGQLDRVAARRVGPGASRALLLASAARGQRLGDVKPARLFVRGDIGPDLDAFGLRGEEVEARGEDLVLGQDGGRAKSHAVE
jgi:hypothetical protein